MTLDTTGIPTDTANEMAESAIDPTSPVPEGAQAAANERLRQMQERDDLYKAVSGIRSRITTTEEELQKVESRMEGVLQGPDREKLRVKRRVLLDTLEDLRMAWESGQKNLQVFDRVLELDSAQKALTTRKNCQASGAQIATEMRQTIQRLAELYHRWRVLKEEDRVARDVVVSMDPSRFSEVPTYAWSTAVDDNFSEGITRVIGESLRAEKDLKKRQEARPLPGAPGGS